MNKLREDQLKEDIEQGFIINDIHKATWALKKIKAIEEKKQQLKEIKDYEIESIENWYIKETAELEKDRGSLETLLHLYYLENKKIDKKFKLSTPYGTVNMRKSKKWNYQDEKELINYLKESNNAELIRVKEELDKAKIKAVFKDGINPETGEILPSVYIEEVETVNIKINE